MKRGILLFLVVVLCIGMLSGCRKILSRLDAGVDAMLAEPTEQPAATTAPTEAPTQPTVPPTEPTTVPTEPEVTQAPTEPFSEKLPYLMEVPAEACIFKGASLDAAFNRTVGSDGTFTIVEEVRDTNGQIWGRLKSGAGWVNVTDLFCHGTKAPAVTVSYTGKVMKKSYTYRAGEKSGEYVTLLTFMPHQRVYNVKVMETHPALDSDKTITTFAELAPGEAVVVGVMLMDFNDFYISYQDDQGKTGHAYVVQNYGDGPALYFRYD